MTLDPKAVGAVGDVRTISWTSKDALLYAVGIGAGHADLQFSTENTTGVDQRAYPTFAVVAGSGSAPSGESAMSRVGSYDMSQVVHGSQAITLHGPIPGPEEEERLKLFSALMKLEPFQRGMEELAPLGWHVDAATTGDEFVFGVATPAATPD